MKTVKTGQNRQCIDNVSDYDRKHQRIFKSVHHRLDLGPNMLPGAQQHTTVESAAALKTQDKLEHYRGRGHGRANYQNSNGAYQYQYYMHDPQPEQYGPPCSLCSRFNHSPKHCYKREHDINNIMEKMSINPQQSQQNNLYQ